MLIVVEDGDVQLLFQALFDFEAPGTGNVLQVDRSEGRGKIFDGLDDFFGIGRIEADREGIDIAELLEEDGLSFHDRHGGLWTDIAKTKHGCTIGDDGHQISLGGIFIYVFGMGVNGQTRGGDTGRIGGGKFVAVGDGDLGYDGNLAMVPGVHFK